MEINLASLLPRHSCCHVAVMHCQGEMKEITFCEHSEVRIQGVLQLYKKSCFLIFLLVPLLSVPEYLLFVLRWHTEFIKVFYEK